ncbi:MAG TPA: MarR family winged helix-turn-helix transcriptional regulator [Thermodesulfobacteriota bacterium]|nr:MarR family winged helix-turn-helix transcriptional regulator [Thermodesulfobacteriota bacterium]
MTSKTKKAGGNPDFADLALNECLDCLCYEFRKTARVVINFYDDALKSTDLKSNQFLILVAVASMKSTNFKTLAEFLGIDQSTLARNLVTVEKQGFVTVKHGKNRREKIITLSRKGKQKLASAFPFWQKAQKSLLDKVGTDRWHKLRAEMAEVADAAREQD